MASTAASLCGTDTGAEPLYRHSLVYAFDYSCKKSFTRPSSLMESEAIEDVVTVAGAGEPDEAATDVDVQQSDCNIVSR